MKNLFLFLIFYGVSCRTQMPCPCRDELPLCIKLNSGKYDAFGLPLKSDMEHFEVRLDTKEIQSWTLGDGILRFYPAKKNLVQFYFGSPNQEIFGTFLIPNFKELKYNYTYDPETLMPVILRPHQCISPIRTGLWKFIEQGKLDSLEYVIQIDPNNLKM